MLKNNIAKSLILFLLMSQFVTLAHAIEHQLVTDENEQCLICIHHNDNNNSLLETFTSSNPCSLNHEKIYQNQVYPCLVTLSLYNIRSPPQYLI